jgi:anti-anti-sigma factor
MQGITPWDRLERQGDPSIEVSCPRQDVVRITLLGEHDLASVPSLDRTIDDLLCRASHLVIDLTETEFIDSSTIHALVRAHQRSELNGIRFNLLIYTDTIVRRALEIGDVLAPLNAVETLDDALEYNPIGNGHATATASRSVQAEGGEDAGAA